MAKKRRKKSKKIVLTKNKISIGCIILGVLYFFVKMNAPSSILFKIFSIPGNFLMGEIGTTLFFGLVIAFGIILFFKENIIKHRRKMFLLLFVALTIINFPILKGHISEDHIDRYGGSIGWLGIKLGAMLLGNQIKAVEIFYSAIALLLVGRIFISLNIKISRPNISIELAPSDDEVKKKEDNKAQNEQKVIAKPSKTNEKPEKKGNLLDLINKALEKKEEKIEVSNENSETTKEKTIASSFKGMLKEKITQKIGEKEFNKLNEQISVRFPIEKPTFDINILKPNNVKASEIDQELLMRKAEAIKTKLEEFEIKVEIEGFNIGPSVVQIKIRPDAGVKISKIENLQQDLSMAVKTKSLRIIAPIPGTDTVGIEIPNPEPQIVRIREMLESNELKKSMSEGFTNLCIGKSIEGKFFVRDLEGMPHLLVAGATNTGKSVGINGLITSLIYQNTPSELKFIMIDPKQVELGIYEGIPYLLSPIITEPDKAVKVLKWTVEEMERRYFKLKEVKVRNLHEYNDKVIEEEKLYRIVLIIDELADLMMSGKKKDTEEAITRIAQKARAVGIHLILATQRPSVNVITGLIKANIPTRISFAVVSQIDSRTILDMKGSEDLVGKGDLLYIDPKNKFPTRVQAPLIETIETEKLVDFIKDKYMQGIDEKQIYHPEIIHILEAKGETVGGGEISEGDDELVNQAIEIIQQTHKASATLLQRKLGIGFARAARVMDILEERGIVGPQEGARPREILI